MKHDNKEEFVLYKYPGFGLMSEIILRSMAVTSLLYMLSRIDWTITGEGIGTEITRNILHLTQGLFSILTVGWIVMPLAAVILTFFQREIKNTLRKLDRFLAEGEKHIK